MNEIEIVKEIMKEREWSFQYLAERMGKKTGSVVGNRLSGRSMTVEVLVEMLEAMDCELVVRPVSGNKTNKTYIVLNENRKGEKRKGVYHPRKKNDLEE